MLDITSYIQKLMLQSSITQNRVSGTNHRQTSIPEYSTRIRIVVYIGVM